MAQLRAGTYRFRAQRVVRVGGEVKEIWAAKDFISKYSIALKEASECRFWINILIQSNVVPAQKFSSILEEVNCIIKILIATINTLKRKQRE